MFLDQESTSTAYNAMIYTTIFLGMICIGVVTFGIKMRRSPLLITQQETTETVKKDGNHKGYETIEHNENKEVEPTTPMLRLVVEKVIEKTASTLTVDDASNLDSINFRNRADSRVCSALKIQLQRAIETSKREVDRGMFQVGEQIGSGNFGQVYKGILTGLVNENSMTTVAIKTINDEVNETELENIICEIKIMSSVDPHLNLVSMVAACSSEYKPNGKLWLLLEYCQHGDLKDFLLKNSAKISCGTVDDDLNYRCLIKWAYDIANGMEYLASKEIMHGDLAARNVLLDENLLKEGCPVAKIADFGLAKKFNEYMIYEKESRMFVPWRWMALEYLTNNYFTLKSDVWSFGVLLWEIFSLGKVPYGQQSYDEVLDKLKKGYTLPAPDEFEYVNIWSPVALYKTVSEKCFIGDPNERSSFSDVVKMIDEELDEGDKSKYKNMKKVYNLTNTENYLKLKKC